MIKINLKNLEPIFFLTIALLNLAPALVGKYFASMDGAAHIYNSKLIVYLLNGDTYLNNYYALNFLVPNLSGHVIMAFFSSFLPAWIAEKILVVGYLIAMPYAFRKLIQSLPGSNVSLSYFGFPFAYSFLFILGFYNFHIGVVFFLITLSYWIRRSNKTFRPSDLILGSLFLTLTFFSHLLVFAILLGFLGLHILSTTFYNLTLPHRNRDECLKGALIKIASLFIMAILPLSLSFYYFKSRPVMGADYSFLTTKELITSLLENNSLIGYSYEFEKEWIYYLQLSILLLIVTVVVLFVRYLYIRFWKRKIGVLPFQSANTLIFWFSCLAASILAYFFLPNSDGRGGFISIRVAYFFFLVLIIFLSLFKIPKWINWFIVATIIVVTMRLDYYYCSVQNSLNDIADKYIEAEKLIEPHSSVIALDFSGHWLTGHFSNYMGIENPLLILENYEASVGYFPVTWRDDRLPNFEIGNIASNKLECASWASNHHNPQQNADYVFVDGEMAGDDCRVELLQNLDMNYVLLSHSKNSSLYKLKSMRE